MVDGAQKYASKLLKLHSGFRCGGKEGGLHRMEFSDGMVTITDSSSDDIELFL